MEEAEYSDFEEVFKQHNKVLCDLAHNLVRDKDAAHDIVQEVFIKLWSNRKQLSFGPQIRHYLFKATAHTSLNHLRFHKKIVRFDDDDTLRDTLKSSPGHEEVDYKELALHARHAIDRLPPKCKAIYILSRHEGLKYQEIADTLNLSIKTVENQMGIALEKLREDLKPFLSIDLLVTIMLITFSLFALLS